jgi:exodeoxyribonuclease VII large subunit
LTQAALGQPRATGSAAAAAISVSQLTRYVANLLAGDLLLADVWVRGELSSLSRPGSGHLYFSLKDEESCLNCVMWRSRAALLGFRLEEGSQVLAHGRIDLYARRGQYQLVADEIEPDGLGAFYLALEQLKQQLEAEGLFALQRKRPIPAFPRRVAVVTSLTGAAVQDIRTVLCRSPHPPEIVLVPAAVQGQEAAASICAAIARADDWSRADTIIVGRGGGSVEDLMPFNAESVVRAIAGSRIPVISAVGHETDTTLADLAADERCPTPTAAAESILRRRQATLDFLATIPVVLSGALARRAAWDRQRLDILRARRALREPVEIVERRRQRVDDAGAQLGRAMERSLDRRRQRLALTASQLDGLSPLAVLARGFARVVRLPDAAPVRRVADLDVGSQVRVSLRDGRFDAEVLALAPEAEEH